MESSLLQVAHTETALRSVTAAAPSSWPDVCGKVELRASFGCLILWLLLLPLQLNVFWASLRSSGFRSWKIACGCSMKGGGSCSLEEELRAYFPQLTSIWHRVTFTSCTVCAVLVYIDINDWNDCEQLFLLLGRWHYELWPFTLTADQPKVKGEAVFQVLLRSVTHVSPEEAELLTSCFQLQKKKLWPTVTYSNVFLL